MMVLEPSTASPPVLSDICVLSSQESQAIPLVSVASVTSGGNANRAVKRQLSNMSEEERLEKQGDSAETGKKQIDPEYDLRGESWLQLWLTRLLRTCRKALHTLELNAFHATGMKPRWKGKVACGLGLLPLSIASDLLGCRGPACLTIWFFMSTPESQAALSPSELGHLRDLRIRPGVLVQRITTALTHRSLLCLDPMSGARWLWNP